MSRYCARAVSVTRTGNAGHAVFARFLLLGASAAVLNRLQHTPGLALHGSGIANASRRKVARAGIQPLGQRPWGLPADLLAHAPCHPSHLVSARYHVQGPLQNNRFARNGGRVASQASVYR